jgi:Flp pilus assembly protein TadD
MRRAGVVGVVSMAALAWLLPARPLQGQEGRKHAYVELTNPQSDDLGRCIARAPKGVRNRVRGRVSARAETRAVTVNGTPAHLYRRADPVIEAPAGWPRCGFEAWLPKPAPDELTVAVTDGTGRVTEVRFVRDTDRTLSRLRALAGSALRGASAYCRVGRALLECDQVAQAKEQYSKAVELDPNSASAHSHLGHLLWIEGSFDEAIAELEAAMRLDPTDAGSHMLLGAALSVQGDPKRGMVEVREAQALEPADPDPHWVMGMILVAEGKPEEAMAEQREAVELEPNFPEARLLLARLLTQHDKPEEAVVHSRKVLDIDPQLADARVELARALYRQDEIDDGVAECRKALEAEPENAEGHAVLAGLLMDQHKVDESMAESFRALELDPANGWAYAALACALYEKGRYVEAEQMMILANRLGVALGEELQDDISDKARLMRSWMMDGRLTMAAMFLPLLGVLAAMGVGSVRAGGRELYPRTLAWRQLMPLAFILTVGLAAVFAIQALFRTAHIGPNAYGYVTLLMGLAAITAGLGLLGLLAAISGRPSKAVRGPGGVPYYCAECRQSINFWRMYYDGRKTLCANCLAAAGSPTAPRPDRPPPTPPPADLPPPVPPGPA